MADSDEPGQDNTATIEVLFAGEAVEITYRIDIVSELQTVRADGPIKTLLDIMARMITGWDLTEEGQPVEPTLATLRRLPIMLTLAILGTIVVDMQERQA